MANNKDFKVKNGIKPTAYQEALGTVVSGSVGYGISETSYDSVSLDVSAQENNPTGVFFKDDGTKLYIVGLGGDEVNEYTLSTAWDITTASANHAFSVSGQDTSPRGLTFSPDGTKMYICGDTGNDINQYTLSTAWTLSTASYTRVFSVSGQTTAPRGIHFKTDGTKMFVSGSQNTLEYALSTAWDISTASYTQAGADVSPSYNAGLFFTSDGLTMYKGVWFGVPTSIYKYTLSTAWDLSSAVLSESGDVQNEAGTTPLGVYLKPDGTKMWVVGNSTDTIYQYSTVQTTAELDLSTGSVFDYTPTSDVQVTLTNPAASGTSSGATLLLSSEDATGVSSAFSTTLYTGNGSTQTITNGIDLAGGGGMVWTKGRSNASNHHIVDTERGTGDTLFPNTSGAEFNMDSVTGFLGSGFTLGNNSNSNANGNTFVSWSFKKKTKFFDIVTYSGTGNAGLTINHNLGSVPGCIIIKSYDDSRDWSVYHRGVDATNPEDYALILQGTNAREDNSAFFNDTAPTATQFTVGNKLDINRSGYNYIAYVFAHDTSATSAIKCGGFVQGTSSYDVDLGFEPQWLLIKSATSVTNWYLFDNKRGVATGGNDAVLLANNTTAEASTDPYLDFTSTGFTSRLDQITGNQTYVYMAIANPSASTITYDSSIQFGGGTAPTAPANGETDVITFNTTDGGTTYKSALAIDGAK